MHTKFFRILHIEQVFDLLNNSDFGNTSFIATVQNELFHMRLVYVFLMLLQISTCNFRKQH